VTVGALPGRAGARAGRRSSERLFQLGEHGLLGPVESAAQRVGLGRIMSELKKLGLKISKGEVRNILLENGFDPGPRRGEGSWDEFIRMHAKTFWACDFLSKKLWTLGGLVEHFVLSFIQPGTW
jgi:hypothetical protein